MTFGQRLKKARTEQNLTQKQLSEMLSVKHNSISNWENDINKPDPDSIELLCGILEITPNYLLSYAPDDFSPAEKLVIKKYRELDEHGKKIVDFMLQEEWERGTFSKKQDDVEVNRPPHRFINYYYRLASAGTGQIVFDMPPTKTIEIPDTKEYKCANYALGVNGSSMEPTYMDGDTLLVEMAETIGVGEIGIFLVDGECYVKELGIGKLISLNPKNVNIPLSENSKCMGKVIGKL